MAIIVDDIEQDTESMIEAGVYPQDDGTVNVELSEPLVFGSGDNQREVWMVKLHRKPSPAELKKLNVSKYELLMMHDHANRAVLPAISEPQITGRIYDQLDGGDQQLLIMGIAHFFEPKPRRARLKA